MRRYADPPIVEAICDFHFIPAMPWDATILGLVYNQIKNDFPERVQLPETTFNVTLGIPPVPFPGLVKMQFRRNDGSALVQVGPDNLTVNHLAPYSGWPKYKDMIVQALSAYRSVAAPQGLMHIALRYINRISVPASALTENDSIEIGGYLLAQPSVPNKVPQVFSDWAQRVVIPFDDSDDAPMTLVLQSGTAPGTESFPVSFLLDLTMSPSPLPSNPVPIALDNALMWLELAHASIETVFEECLGTQARDLFGLIASEE